MDTGVPVATVEFPFRFDPVALPLRAMGVSPSTCMVRVTDTELDVRFGPLRCRTPLANVCDIQVTYDYTAHKAIGPRASFVDAGATFGTSTYGGVCICFKERVRALLVPPRRNSALTVTVQDIDGLATLLRERCGLPR